MATLTAWTEAINRLIWNGPMPVLLLGVHLYLTLRLRFPQRRIGQGIRDTFRSGERGGFSAFSCLMVNLAATLGVGNIVGVALAVVLGGPGAVFWCWLSGLLGIVTTYAEDYLSLRFRRRQPDGSFTGGPMQVLAALRRPHMARFYALGIALAGLGIGTMVPSNAVAEAGACFGLPRAAAGAILTVLTGLVVLGGVQSIKTACERLVPLVVLVYTVGCLAVIARNFGVLGESLRLIVVQAFDFRAAAGGFAGAAAVRAVRYGVSRGLFSNEAGMGTAAIAVSAVEPGDPARQAMVGATATFWDTVVFCAITGLAFVTAQVRDPAAFAGLDGLSFCFAVFRQIPGGNFILLFSLLLLGFACIVGWCYIGTRAFCFVFAGRERLYALLWTLCVFVGALAALRFLWGVADLINAMVIVPNIYAILSLRRLLFSAETATATKKSGINPIIFKQSAQMK